ncbi:MAG: hypothetical protein OZ921_01960 [Sorangiineae bacterium]|nr:hypothetical protein [Polyangiaceae bacterium]MEB2321249.1 hypothetical protein [Sorangiineae bacterium]
MRTRTVELLQGADHRWRELFAHADVMSEGALRDEADGRVYYGSTSILFMVSSRGGPVPDDQVALLQRLLVVDPHVRLRAVRVACLEAQVRSEDTLGRVDAELSVRAESRGIRIDVEVQARTRARVVARRHRS